MGHIWSCNPLMRLVNLHDLTVRMQVEIQAAMERMQVAFSAGSLEQHSHEAVTESTLQHAGTQVDSGIKKTPTSVPHCCSDVSAY